MKPDPPFLVANHSKEPHTQLPSGTCAWPVVLAPHSEQHADPIINRHNILLIP